MKPTSVLDTARSYLAAGLGVLPIRPDGTKAPDLPKGHQFLKVRPTDADLVRWFRSGRNGIAIPGGKVSGSLECLDFETVTVWQEWTVLVESQIPHLAERLSWVRTPGHYGEPGMHARYRCPGFAVPGSHDLAAEPQLDEWQEPVRDSKTGRHKQRLLIETRGEGGYAVAPGSPPGCHESGRLWEPVAGTPPLTELPDLTVLEREVLISSAQALNRWVEEADLAAERPSQRREQGLLPGDDYNLRGPDWSELLEGEGWVCVRTAGAVRYWRRPGKSACWSATTGFCKAGAVDLLHVFSGAAAPFKQGGSYSKFRAYALLRHQGDFKAAASALAKLGFGQPRGAGPAPAEKPADQEQKKAEPPVPILIRMSDVVAKAVQWRWRHWMPEGALCVLDGDPGLGKTTLTLDLAARTTRGLAMPPLNGPDAGLPPAGVLLLGAEDSLEHTVRPRLDAAGADCKRVHFLDAVRQGNELRPPVLPYDLDLVADQVRTLGVKLIVVDPLMAFLGSEFDAHKDQDIRRCLRPLSQLAMSLGVVILLLRHLNKLNGGAALYRGGASIGITGAARAALIVGRDPEDPQRYVLAMNKSNLGPTPKSLTYRLNQSPHPKAGSVLHLRWEGECDLGPADILWHAQGRGPGRPDDSLREAKEFLLDILSGGPQLIESIKITAEAADLSWGTLKRAKVDMNIQTSSQGKDYFWALPGPKAKRGHDIPD